MNIERITTNKITVATMDALADAMGTHYTRHEKRCGKWGKVLGNTWGTTNQELFTKGMQLLAIGCRVENWEAILLDATNSRGLPLFQLTSKQGA